MTLMAFLQTLLNYRLMETITAEVAWETWELPHSRILKSLRKGNSNLLYTAQAQRLLKSSRIIKEMPTDHTRQVSFKSMVFVLTIRSWWSLTRWVALTTYRSHRSKYHKLSLMEKMQMIVLKIPSNSRLRIIRCFTIKWICRFRVQPSDLIQRRRPTQVRIRWCMLESLVKLASLRKNTSMKSIWWSRRRPEGNLHMITIWLVVNKTSTKNSLLLGLKTGAMQKLWVRHEADWPWAWEETSIYHILMQLILVNKTTWPTLNDRFVKSLITKRKRKLN